MSSKGGKTWGVIAAAIALVLALAVGLAVFGLPSWHRGASAVRTHPPKPPPHRRHSPARAPLRAKPSEPHDSPVPILMYHAIAVPPADARYPLLFVSPVDFSAEVDLLARDGFHAVTLERVFRYWSGRETLPAKPVVFSFDDGYRSVFVNAFPILRARGWPGVVNMEVNNMHVSWGLQPRLLRDLIAADWEIDAHSLTHPNLTTLDDAELKREVAGSRAVLEQQLRTPVDFFCYPIGRYDDRVIAAVKAAGFMGAMTVNPGLATPSDPYRLSRVRVSGRMDAAGLVAELDALGTPR